MSMERIRRYYGVPAKRGMRVVVDGHPAIITGTTRGPMYLRARPVDGGRSFPFHPTWHVEYPVAESGGIGEGSDA